MREKPGKFDSAPLAIRLATEKMPLLDSGHYLGSSSCMSAGRGEKHRKTPRRKLNTASL
jgi:hypothetical protein